MTREIIFEKAAACWEEALPIGNGKLGAMIFGGAETDLLQMNEDSIWYGRPVNRINPDAYAHLEKVRSLILGGKPDEAETLLRYTFSGMPQSQRIYQPLADCQVRMDGVGEIKAYDRRLDLNDAVVRVWYQTEQGEIRKEYFASAKAGVIVMKLDASCWRR